MSQAARALEQVFRAESGPVLATLIRILVSERLKPSKFGRDAVRIGEGAAGVVTEEKRPGGETPSLEATGSLVDAT